MKRIGSKVGQFIGSLMTTGGSVIALTVFVSTMGFSALVGLLFGLKWAMISAILLLLVSSPALLSWGIIPVVLGWVMLRGSKNLHREVIRDRFLQLVKAKRGRFTAVEFSRVAQLELSVARTYLDRWARECHADFDVTEAGEIQYLFLEPNLLTSGSGQPFEIFEQMREKVSLP
jgi:hypothetical protein